jgi:hypothetical protein
MSEPNFSKRDVTVTMLGEEWFAIIARLARKNLSREGLDILKRAQEKLSAQVTAQST